VPSKDISSVEQLIPFKVVAQLSNRNLCRIFREVFGDMLLTEPITNEKVRTKTSSYPIYSPDLVLDSTN
jgi:hypothetical protein